MNNMISSRKDYKWYLKADELALRIPQSGAHLRIKSYFSCKNWRFQRKLRKTEYVNNCSKTIIGKLYGYFLRYRLIIYGDSIGYAIPINVCGPGLALVHIGPIIINGKTRIGNNFRCQAMVNIGHDERLDSKFSKAPIIGDNVVVMPGVKMFGDIRIADNIVIGANAVVNKSFLEPGITIAGVPAKKISDKSSLSIIPGNPANDAKI